MVIYEVITGSYPFEQTPSIAVPHAIQDGERPKVKVRANSISALTRCFKLWNYEILPRTHFHCIMCCMQNEGIWMPHMISLMKQCWAQNPNERPSADDIISRMAREDFYALHAAYQQEALPVTCVLAIPVSRLFERYPLFLFIVPSQDQMYLRFWTWCVDSHCEYHVFDTKNGLSFWINTCLFCDWFISRTFQSARRAPQRGGSQLHALAQEFRGHRCSGINFIPGLPNSRLVELIQNLPSD